MNIIDLATKTLQLAIQTAIAGVKTVVDGIKNNVDTIDNRTTSMNSNINTINTNVDTLLNGRVVKSVQRGRFNTPDAVQHTVVLSRVNPDKCHVEFYGTSSSDQFPHVHTLSENQLIIQAGPTPNAKFNINTYYMSWEVIEFY